MEQLQAKVKIIWKIITDAEDYILAKYPDILLDGHPTASIRLPKEIVFKSAQQLHDEFPNKDIHRLEDRAVEKYGALFIAKMGWPMEDGSPAEEQRSPSYDDWNLNVSACTIGMFLNRSLRKCTSRTFHPNRETSWFVTL